MFDFIVLAFLVAAATLTCYAYHDIRHGPKFSNGDALLGFTVMVLAVSILIAWVTRG